jgi:hypothetical protein
MPHPVDVVVDLGRVTFLDCAGIGALVAGRNTAAQTGCGYPVVNGQRHVRLGPGHHRCPRRPQPGSGAGTVGRSADPITPILAPQIRPAGSGWTASAVDGRCVRVPHQCELWDEEAVVDGARQRSAGTPVQRVESPPQANCPWWTSAPTAPARDRADGGQTLGEHENPGEATGQVLRGPGAAGGRRRHDGRLHRTAADRARRPAHRGGRGGRGSASYPRPAGAAEGSRPGA